MDPPPLSSFQPISKIAPPSQNTSVAGRLLFPRVPEDCIQEEENSGDTQSVSSPFENLSRAEEHRLPTRAFKPVLENMSERSEAMTTNSSSYSPTGFLAESLSTPDPVSAANQSTTPVSKAPPQPPTPASYAAHSPVPDKYSCTSPPPPQTKERLVPSSPALQTNIRSSCFTSSFTPFHVIFGLKSLNDGYEKSGEAPSASNKGLSSTQCSSSSSTSSNASFASNAVTCVQTISFHRGPIWAAKFSPSGEYLCTGGEDCNVVIWFVGRASYACQQPLNGNAKHHRGAGSPNSTNPNVLLDPTPHRVLKGHSGDIVDICWSGENTYLHRVLSSDSIGAAASSSSASSSSAAAGAGSSGISSAQHAHIHLNFVLTASTDKTVRLWHVDKDVCLQVFRHPDIVTAVQFAPESDKKFVSACFDKRVRIWEIVPDPIIRNYCTVREMVTAVCFTPDGSQVICGQVNGNVVICDANNAKIPGISIRTMMSCKRSRGKYSDGTKVTGFAFVRKHFLQQSTTAGGGRVRTSKEIQRGSKEIQRGSKELQRSGSGTTLIAKSNDQLAVSAQPQDSRSNLASGSSHQLLQGSLSNVSHISKQQQQQHSHTHVVTQHHLLVTTNDHRIRLLNLEDRSIICKYKGHANAHMQIRATVSECTRFIICGSDNGFVHVWPTSSSTAGPVATATAAASTLQVQAQAQLQLDDPPQPSAQVGDGDTPGTWSSWLGALFAASTGTSTTHQREVCNNSEYFNANLLTEQNTRPTSSGSHTTVTARARESITQTISAQTSAQSHQCANVAMFVPANALVCACRHHPELGRLSDFDSLLQQMEDVALNHLSPVPINPSSSVTSPPNSIDSGAGAGACAGSTPRLSPVDNSFLQYEHLNCVSRAILATSYDGTMKIFVRGLK